MWKRFGIKATSSDIKCCAPHPVDLNRFLYFVSDFPHLLKCLRNMLLKCGFDTPHGRIPLFGGSLHRGVPELLERLGATCKKWRVPEQEYCGRTESHPQEHYKPSGILIISWLSLSDDRKTQPGQFGTCFWHNQTDIWTE
ncbi:uncharacterized protein LOC135393046 [Ornithodoros turicata]